MSFATMSQLMLDFEFEKEIASSLIVREPAGVVGAITPWNYPLHQIAAKVAPALAAGCTVVLKPSGEAPLNAFALAEVLDEVGLPPGVFNLVSGPGSEVGEAMSSHPLVDMISLTGSTSSGQRVMRASAGTIKRVALELGGKSACVILEDADLQAAVGTGVSMCYLNSGQTCSAQTRMVVPRSRLSEIEDLVVEQVAAYTPGDPMDMMTRLGPLVSAAQRESVLGYITKGMDEGARLIAGGREVPEGLERGFFVKATVFTDVDPDSTIAQEEIFGPVLSMIPFDDEEEAVRIANNSTYGLGGAVWAGERAHAERVARRIRTGQVDVNGGGWNHLAPFGGYKQSGIGRELGPFGLEEFLQVKSIQR
jgi:betaine-aldehyde dehydrogenase